MIVSIDTVSLSRCVDCSETKGVVLPRLLNCSCTVCNCLLRYLLRLCVPVDVDGVVVLVDVAPAVGHVVIILRLFVAKNNHISGLLFR